MPSDLRQRRRLVLVALACLLGLTGFLVAEWGTPLNSHRHTGTAVSTVALCDGLGREISRGKISRSFLPGRVTVPEAFRKTSFGSADAECVADPNLGLYYVALVWHEVIPAQTLTTFLDHLHGAGFRDTTSIEPTIALKAPTGMTDVIDGATQQMNEVLILQSRTNSMTYVMWI